MPENDTNVKSSIDRREKNDPNVKLSIERREKNDPNVKRFPDLCACGCCGRFRSIGNTVVVFRSFNPSFQ